MEVCVQWELYGSSIMNIRFFCQRITCDWIIAEKLEEKIPESGEKYNMKDWSSLRFLELNRRKTNRNWFLFKTYLLLMSRRSHTHSALGQWVPGRLGMLKEWFAKVWQVCRGRWQQTEELLDRFVESEVELSPMEISKEVEHKLLWSSWGIRQIFAHTNWSLENAPFQWEMSIIQCRGRCLAHFSAIPSEDNTQSLRICTSHLKSHWAAACTAKSHCT